MEIRNPADQLPNNAENSQCRNAREETFCQVRRSGFRTNGTPQHCTKIHAARESVKQGGAGMTAPRANDCKIVNILIAGGQQPPEVVGIASLLTGGR